MEMQDKVNKVVRRKKQDDEGFSYVCQVCDFDCVGRKGIMKHFNEGHSEELDKIKSELKGEDVDAQLTKLVMNSAFVEEKSNGVPEKHKNGVVEKGKEPGKAEAKAKGAVKPKLAMTIDRLDAMEKVQEDTGRKDYPVTLDVMKMIDARTTRIPNYGSLQGRIARLVAVVVGKKEIVEIEEEEEEEEKKEKEGEKMEEEDEEPNLYCFKCNEGLGSSYSVIMPHLEEKHEDFLNVLYTMFPPAKKRMGQFIEKAAAKFKLEVPSLKDVEKLIKIDEDEKQKQRDALLLKRKQELAAERAKQEEERKEKMRKLEEERKKKQEEWNKKNPPLTENQRRMKERDRVKAELKKIKGQHGGMRRQRLEKRL